MENDTTPNTETPDTAPDVREAPVVTTPEVIPAAVESPVEQTKPAEQPKPPKPSKLPMIVLAAVTLVLGLGLGFSVASLLQPKETKTASQLPAPQQTAEKKLTVPEGATVIAECAKGRGKQYVLPKDIPQGPVYNVYDGKVIGVEYMLGQQDVLSSKDYLNLPLQGVKYDHINIGLLSKGHSGYPDPHYHVDIFTISHEEAAKITCQ